MLFSGLKWKMLLLLWSLSWPFDKLKKKDALNLPFGIAVQLLHGLKFVARKIWGLFVVTILYTFLTYVVVVDACVVCEQLPCIIMKRKIIGCHVDAQISLSS